MCDFLTDYRLMSLNLPARKYQKYLVHFTRDHVLSLDCNTDSVLA
jgi:hypothetical protein